MKNTNKTLAVIASLLVLSSCNEKEEMVQDNSLASQIEKIETSYVEGSSKKETKENTTTRRSIEKDETFANDELIRRIEDELIIGDSGGGGGTGGSGSGGSGSGYVPPKNVVAPTSAIGQVGVFKHTSCGGYPELKVFMDNEDGRNISTVSGDGGAIRFDRNGNVTITFCIVPSSSFSRHLAYEYAVLNVSGSLKHGVSRIDRLFDNEDSNNKNNSKLHTYTPWASYPKETVASFNGNYGYSNLGGRNTLLVFDYYKSGGGNAPAISPLPSIPNLYKYGALGRFVHNATGYSGYLLTDDEDSRNANYLRVTEFNDATNSLKPQVNVGSINGMIEGGGNTKLYISFN